MADSKTLDRALTIALAVGIAAVVGFGAYFAYTVYADRVAAENASPAARLAKVLSAQVKATPNDVVMRVRLGEALAAAGKPQQAIEQLNAALKIDPKHTGALLDLGQLAMSQNQPTEAEAFFKKVVEITDAAQFESVDQRREVALYNLGLLALQRKDYQDAIGQFKAALRIRADASDTYYYLGQALLLNGDTDAAIKEIKTALVFDPNFAQAHYQLADAYMKKGDRVGASFEYHKAAELSPNAPEPQKALEQFGLPADLIKKAQSLKESDPDAALEAAQIAANIDPTNLDAVKLGAEILASEGRYKEALKAYVVALKLAPKDAKIKAIVDEYQAKYGTKKK